MVGQKAERHVLWTINQILIISKNSMHFPGWKLSIFKIKNYVGFQKQAYFAFQRYKALKNNNEITSLELLISANHLPLSGQFFVSLEVQSIWVWNSYV